MNYSTLKKTVVLSFVSLMAVGFASAQTDSTKSAKKMSMSDTTSSAKLFGGAGQYNTWSIGLNVGVTTPSAFTGGVNPFTHNKAQLGYGLSIKDQLSHAFGLQLDLHGGKIAGDDSNNGGTVTTDDETGGTYNAFKKPLFIQDH